MRAKRPRREPDVLHARIAQLETRLRALLGVVSRQCGWLPHEDQIELRAAKAVLEE